MKSEIDSLIDTIERLEKKIDILEAQQSMIGTNTIHIMDFFKIAHKESLKMLSANQTAYHKCIEATELLYENIQNELANICNSVSNVGWPL